MPAKTYQTADEDSDVPAKTYQPAQVPVPAKADQPVEEDSGALAKTNQPAQARVPAKTYEPVDEDSDHDESIHDYGSRSGGRASECWWKVNAIAVSYGD